MAKQTAGHSGRLSEISNTTSQTMPPAPRGHIHFGTPIVSGAGETRSVTPSTASSGLSFLHQSILQHPNVFRQGSPGSSFSSIASVSPLPPIHHHQQQQAQSVLPPPTSMVTPLTPSPASSISISLAQFPKSSGPSSLGGYVGPPPPPIHPFHTFRQQSFDASVNTTNIQGGAQAATTSASASNMIYFSSTASEPSGPTSSSMLLATGEQQTAMSTAPAHASHIRRAPDATRHLGRRGERFCLPKPRIYRVLYPYKPQQVDEIELQYGDLLTVTIQCDDGWFLGRSTLSGKFGTFPGNYVELV